MSTPQVDPSAPAEHQRGLRALIARLPAVLIAIVLSAAALAIWYFWTPGGQYLVPLIPFLPGAIQRTNFLHLIVALACAIAAQVLQGAWHFAGIDSVYVLSKIVYPATTMLLVGFIEWWLRGRPGRHQLISVLAACLGAAAIFAIVQTLVSAAQRTVAIPTMDGGVAHYSLAVLVYYPLMAVLLWQAISMGLSPSIRRRSIVLGAAAAAVTLYLACFTWLIFDEARRSLTAEGPMSKVAAADLLAERGNPGDIAALWNVVENANWGQPPEFGQIDYRVHCIDLLAKRDPAETAQRLAALLDSDNKVQLANVAAPLLASYDQYETVPVLLRFACCDDKPCMAALAQMKVPQLAYAILLWASLRERIDFESKQLSTGQVTGDASTGKLKLPQPIQTELVALLGDAKGESIDDWEKHYHEVVDKRPTPLSKEQVKLADRVVAAFQKLWSYKEEWGLIKQRRVYSLAIGKMEADGLKVEAELIESSVKSNSGRLKIAVPKAATPLYRALETLDKYIGQANAQVKEQNLNIEVDGVDGLEKEVEKYGRWVHEQYKAEFKESEKVKVKTEK